MRMESLKNFQWKQNLMTYDKFVLFLLIQDQLIFKFIVDVTFEFF